MNLHLIFIISIVEESLQRIKAVQAQQEVKSRHWKCSAFYCCAPPPPPPQPSLSACSLQWQTQKASGGWWGKKQKKKKKKTLFTSGPPLLMNGSRVISHLLLWLPSPNLDCLPVACSGKPRNPPRGRGGGGGARGGGDGIIIFWW